MVEVLERRRERVRLDGMPVDQPNARARNTVTVACKLPNGLRITAWEMRPYQEVGPQGIRTIERAEPIKALGGFTLKGTAVALGESTAHLVHGYAITENVPKDLWDNWYMWNKDQIHVEENLIFAHEDRQRVLDMCRSFRGKKSGLEPIDPDKPQAIDPRIRRGTRDVGQPDEE